jgi:transposase-like protein
MGQILHPNAKTTHRVREEIQASAQSASVLAQRYNISTNTVRKWKKAGAVTDAKSGAPKGSNSPLTALERQVICETRRTLRLPIDDLLDALKPQIPHLSRSALHRCLQDNGLSRLPVVESQRTERKPFKAYPEGYFHLDTTEIRLADDRWVLFVAIDRTTKWVYIEVALQKTALAAQEFLQNLVAACPYRIHKVLTDNGSEFTYQLLPAERRPKQKVHPFDTVCQQHTIDHRLTPYRSPWTNGQVEVMNKKIKESTVYQYFYPTVEVFKSHLYHWLLAYNHHHKLSSLNRRPPWAEVIRRYELDPTHFHKDPRNMFVGRNK